MQGPYEQDARQPRKTHSGYRVPCIFHKFQTIGKRHSTPVFVTECWRYYGVLARTMIASCALLCCCTVGLVLDTVCANCILGSTTYCQQ